MPQHDSSNASTSTSNTFTGRDVTGILLERAWLSVEPTAEQLAWCDRAAALLGPQAADRAQLADLLDVVFHYDAGEIFSRIETHAVLTREGARDVLRHLALLLLEPLSLTSERFKAIVDSMKETLGMRSRELFHPIRLALTGRAGGGELDRAILLLDEAAALSFPVPVKSARERILEFCASFD
ncbi:MAG TPA: hypothetical protein VJN93_16320 [Candidatus Acidoferrum sp.]|nr:hypothetical protein [Candidatus Acidoferrum sp.]